MEQSGTIDGVRSVSAKSGCGSHHTKTTDLFGCPCCAPVLGELGLLSLPHMAASANALAWKNENLGVPPQAVGLTIFTNATVITADADFSVAEALAIDGDKILAVGSLDDVKASVPDTATIVDAGGKTILPGFIEPHMHFFPIAMLSRFEDVGAVNCPTVASVLDRVGELAKSAKEGEWIIGRQFDPSLQDGPDAITCEMLDPVTGDTPCLLFNASLHIAYCNSAAFKIAGLSAGTPDPEGAAFGRNADGSLNGVCQGGPAFGQVLAHNLAAMALDDVPAACKHVCERANQVGITTFCDQGAGSFQGANELAAFDAFAESGHMTTRLRYSLFGSFADTWDKTDVSFGQGNSYARATGWKIVSDGSNQGRTGLQREPYLGREDKGLAYVAADDLKQQVTQRALEGWQVVVHANGDQAIDNTLDAFEAAYEAGAPRDMRYRIEHCSVLHDEQIGRIKKLGLSPSFLIGHIYYWAKAFRDEVFGPEKANLLGRARSCQDADIPWTMHSDEPVSEMGPLRCIENAVTRKMWKEPSSTLNADERVTVEEAILSITRVAAWQCHSDHEVGSLEVGKYADFVVLDNDPRKVPETEISQIKVLETWSGGRQVYAS
ncbi:amidohydrolase [Pyruvatibacter sp. HU-CL02332]|uniref:amidohydrolase n=1 Tax=Pyruvatibacter sp. HU-CL02332 TaxID=3127650 RepID=UPI003365B238